MRYLAIDIGDKRTGLAVGDDQTRLVTPVGVIQRPITERDGEVLRDELARVIVEHLGASVRSPGELVIGLPLNMDGTEGPQAVKVRAFGDRLAARTGRPVHFQDERLTSVDADWAMARSGMTHREKKGRRDALAAAAILRDFLDGPGRAPRATTPPEGDPPADAG